MSKYVVMILAQSVAKGKIQGAVGTWGMGKDVP